MVRRILVVGSKPRPNRDANEDGKKFPEPRDIEKFPEACVAIGQELARAKCRVILGSFRDSTADFHVLRGMRSIPGVHEVVVVRPLQHAGTGSQEQPRSSAAPGADEEEGQPSGELRITYVPVRGPWGVGRVTQLLRSDVAIVIGGRDGVNDIVGLAPELRRPIVAVPCFGGAAQSAWDSISRDYGQLGRRSMDFNILTRPWTPGHAKTVVDLAILLIGRNPYDDGAWKYLVRLCMAILLLISLWAVIFTYPCSKIFQASEIACSNNRPTMFLLFWLAAFIGTGLRAAKRLAEDPSEKISPEFVIIEGISGLAVAFGLSLIYLAGLFLAADETRSFPMLSESGGDFRRTGVLMSTISFTSAFLLEGSLSKLQEKLRERVLDER